MSSALHMSGALHMWCVEHCTCGALHIAHVQLIALYVFVCCSSARAVGGRPFLRAGGVSGARDGGFLLRRCACPCVAHATTRRAGMGAAAEEEENAPPSLQMEPDAHPRDRNSGTYSPISRLAQRVVIWHPEDLWSVQGHDARSARDMRDQLSRYKRRCFSKAWEDGYSKID